MGFMLSEGESEGVAILPTLVYSGLFGNCSVIWNFSGLNLANYMSTVVRYSAFTHADLFT